MKAELLAQAKQYYLDRYELIARHRFITKKKQLLKDHEGDAQRRCRFCNRGIAEVLFKTTAHAVPEFLGNRDVISLNECDECNEFLAVKYEDQLSKRTLLERAATNVRAKGNRRPTFKYPDGIVRIDPKPGNIRITLADNSVIEKANRQVGPFELTLPGEGASQLDVPILAAKALVKVACSICPKTELANCQPAIEWLMGHRDGSYSTFPVLSAYTPGPVADDVSEVILVRRKLEEPIPYLWCVIQFKNHRLQAFVPFCPRDYGWLREGETVTVNLMQFPAKFVSDWPYGETRMWHEDWSGNEPVQVSSRVTCQLMRSPSSG